MPLPSPRLVDVAVVAAVVVFVVTMLAVAVFTSAARGTELAPGTTAGTSPPVAKEMPADAPTPVRVTPVYTG